MYALYAQTFLNATQENRKFLQMKQLSAAHVALQETTNLACPAGCQNIDA